MKFTRPISVRSTLVTAGLAAASLGALAMGMQPVPTQPCSFVIEMIIRHDGTTDCVTYYECEEGDACTNFGIGEYQSCGAASLWPAICYVYEYGTRDPETGLCTGGQWVFAVDQGERWYYLNPVECGGGVE